MDRLKNSRAPVRGTVTKLINEISDEVQKENPDKDLLQAKLNRLIAKREELKELDEKVKTQMLDDKVPEEEVTAEHSAIEDYEEKVEMILVKVEKVLHPQQPERPPSPVPSTTTISSSYFQHPPDFKLPKMEIKKFNGDVKQWLGFWAQFEKIHDDPKTPTVHKFQVLVQSMEKDSRAKKVVESFPQSVENYEKAVEALKSRFGRKDLLIEVYTRDLIRLITTSIQGQERVKLTAFYDELETHLRALESLGVSSSNSTVWLLPLVESCLPEETLKTWQRSPGYVKEEGEDDERLEKLLKFLRSEVEHEEKLKIARSALVPTKSKPKYKRRDSCYEDDDFVPTAADLFVGEADKQPKCIFCEKNHHSQECFSARKMSLEEKKNKIQRSKGCFVCFRKGHPAKSCKVSVKCQLCDKKHFTLMCPDLPHHKPKEKTSATEVQSSMGNQTCTREVLLQTVMVRMKGKKKSRFVRVLFDGGSQRSYILKKTVADLGLDVIGEVAVVHELFGGVQSYHKHRKYSVTLLGDNFECDFDALDQDVICGRIAQVPKGPWLTELRKKGIVLTDVGDGAPDIEILIGADVMGRFLTTDVLQLDGGLTAVKTRLGWTLMGKVPGDVQEKTTTMIVTSMTIQDAAVHELWSLETLGIRDPVEVKSKSERELAAKDHFMRTVTRNEEGRYEVSLPWIDGQQKIPSNKDVAVKRLYNATKRLESTGRKADYQAVFDEWLKENVIERVPAGQLDQSCHYLPHRPVFKEESQTTKVRPVFDASCKVKGFPSLNDCLEKGPNLIELIPSILLRFREKSIGVISDIRRAFLQISVAPQDRDFLRFLWWEQGKVQEYRHRRVVFGVNCSPFLLGAVIEYHCSKVPEELKATATKLLESLYVDNCVASFDSQIEVDQFRTEATGIMRGAQMDLRMWEQTGQVEDGKAISDVLGLKWNKAEDTLSCSVNPDRLIMDEVTKRKVLSVIHQIYDPIGFLCPVTLAPKLWLQEAWALKLSWDEKLPEEMEQRFRAWLLDVPVVNSVSVPRSFATRSRPAHQLEVRTGSTREGGGRSLHTFVDASKDAYAAVVFLRTESVEEGPIIQLLQAKSRIAPLKRPSICRMELLACVIGARLAAATKEALELKDVPEYYWSDSSTAIAWIRGNDEWGTFVGNRVKEIRKLTGQDLWRHVPGTMNPADLPSRGCSPQKLLHLKWWEGPEWLKFPGQWPSGPIEIDWSLVNEEKKKAALKTLAATEKEPWYSLKFSSYNKTCAVIGWMRRFIMNLRNFRNKRKTAPRELRAVDQVPPLQAEEYDAAELLLLKSVQGEAFEEGVTTIKGIQVAKDVKGLYRVETKITLRDEPYDFRFPIILPSGHPIVEKIILDDHKQNSHAGIQTLMARLRERFWIITARKTIRRVLAQCIRCRRHTAKKIEVTAPPLPLDRVRDAKVFEVTGVDLAGPFYIREGDDYSKVWLVIFTCAVYRAVHFELVTDPSTETFLQSLRRFIARRGRPSTVWSDNGGNFVGSVAAFKEVDWAAIQKYSAAQRIQWKFNPPTAAWWGGWWERLIGMTKKLLVRTLGRASLTYEELLTVICEAEAIINSRPLTYISEDPNDLVPLSPSMFLQEIEEIGVPDLDELDAHGFAKRYRYRQKLREEFRSRFRQEYLGQLVRRQKELGKSAEPSVGDVVLVGADNKKRYDWQMGKILELIPGRDGKVRVARVKTRKNVVTRPVQRLYPLEVRQQCLEEALPVPETGKKPEEPFCPDEDQVRAEVRTRGGRVVKKPKRFC